MEEKLNKDSTVHRLSKYEKMQYNTQSPFEKDGILYKQNDFKTSNGMCEGIEIVIDPTSNFKYIKNHNTK